jgi:hypothetical protein
MISRHHGHADYMRGLRHSHRKKTGTAHLKLQRRSASNRLGEFMPLPHFPIKYDYRNRPL